jgi:hypothetical protein
MNNFSFAVERTAKENRSVPLKAESGTIEPFEVCSLSQMSVMNGKYLKSFYPHNG